MTISHPIPKLRQLTACVLFGMSAVAATVASAGVVSSGILLNNATIVNTQTGALTPFQSVVIEGGRIRTIAPYGTLWVGGSARAIDAGGRFLVPGYLDMHTHALNAARNDPKIWQLMLANGITGVREMGGSVELIQLARQVNTDSANGSLIAPEVLAVPGDLLVGITSAAQGAERVRAQKAVGASFIKLVNANRDGAFGVLAEAKLQGLGVAGHLPLALTSADAAQAGWQSIEHLGAAPGALLDCSTSSETIRQALLSGAGAPPVTSYQAIVSPMLYRDLDGKFYQQALDTYDAARCGAVARAYAAGGTWHAPTLIRLRAANYSDSAEFRTMAQLAYVDKGTRALWEQLAQEATTRITPASKASFQQYYVAQRRMVKLLVDNGVKLLAGSDYGGIWVVPGFALHQEARELATAGLTPLQILQSVTLNGARFLKRESTMGSVAVGKDANLVLLDANPVADSANLAKIAAVFRNGRYYSRATLDDMKRAAAQAYSSAPASAPASDPGHVH